MLRKRISLRDVGKAAGFSHVTVSLALRNHPSIPASTRERIKASAEKLGYKPDPMLRALADYRWEKRAIRYQGSLAWINNYPKPEQLENNYQFSRYRAGAEQRARERGYQLVALNPVAEGITPAKLRRVLINRGIQGLLLPPQPVPHAILDFDFTGFSAVAFGFTLLSPVLHVVANCHYRTSMLAMRMLRGSGHRRIGLILSRHISERTEGMFLGGFLGGQAGFPARDQIPALLLQAPPGEKEKEELLRWMRAHQPDAIITDALRWIAETLKSKGICVPRDISLASTTAGPKARGFAGIDQNDLEIGSRATDTLVGMLNRNETGVPEIPCRILIESAWREGNTVQPRN